MMWITGKKNYKEFDDEALIKLYCDKGDSRALGVLFERYSHLVYGVCLKYLRNEDESKDATLNIFEKLMTDLKRFKIEKFSYWIHTVSRNHCLMILRNRKTTYSIDNEIGRGIDGFVETHQQSHLTDKDDTESKLQLMEEGIKLLNEEQRICIELFYLKKYCYQDVAEISGFSMHQVKSFIQNGKRNLKNYMINHQNEIK